MTHLASWSADSRSSELLLLSRDRFWTDESCWVGWVCWFCSWEEGIWRGLDLEDLLRCLLGGDWPVSEAPWNELEAEGGCLCWECWIWLWLAYRKHDAEPRLQD